MDVLRLTIRAKLCSFDYRQGSQFATKLIRVSLRSAVYPGNRKEAALTGMSALGWREMRRLNEDRI
ncbi:hypothetical protein BLL36_12725 [Pseudomonas cedrina subsp. cedrina]|uniref:Uncharacterized protein n=1 Tax=Pseudomonas cedrina subsp. cedrina TaxID=76762 RepID=A0A1V2KCD3_PSECE|nr:hypothetical protein BLL36_12725 [Pseudomonas cedrina subsp. cedrina]